MVHLRYNIACCIFVLLVSTIVEADFQDYLEHTAIHLPEKKFSSNEYSEYSDNDNRDRESLAPPQKWDPFVYNPNPNGYFSRTTTGSVPQIPDAFDENIVWDDQWSSKINFGQISAVSIDPHGNIGIFHRGSRVWSSSTFDTRDNINRNYGPIRENTLIVLDKTGNLVKAFGARIFYMPHGLTIDMYGNFWVTDVGLHQVFKFDAKDIALVQGSLRGNRAVNIKNRVREFPNRRRKFFIPIPEIKPSMALGEPFEHGNDEKRFCKPTAVAVQMDGTFFVSDGYCNSRIIKFNANGERIAHWGRHWGTENPNQPPPEYALYIPHALTLDSESNLLYVADRENGRVMTYFTTNGTFYKEYKHPSITKVYSVVYARERLYLVNGPDPTVNVHVRGYVLDANSGDIVSQFGPGRDMYMPHDIAVSEDASEIYVGDLNFTAYRFLQNVSTQSGISVAHSRRINSHHETAPLTDNDITNSSGGTTTATLVLSLVTAAVICIALCVAIAAVVARCQKRGRLFQYDESTVEFSKLVQ